jgi:hypothetical protein
MAGLKTNDAILAINGQLIADGKDLARQISSQGPESAVDLRIQRADGEQTIKVKLGARPASNEGASNSRPDTQSPSNKGPRLGLTLMDGESDEGVLIAEVEEGSITGSASAQVALFRPPAALQFDNRITVPLRPNGTDTADLTLNMIDDLGQIVGYSGPFNGELTAQGGTVSAPTGLYVDGRLPVKFTAGTEAGMATIQAMGEGGLTTSTTILLAQPVATGLELTADRIDLRTVNEATLTARVFLNTGGPAANQTVRLSVSDDEGSKGKIAGGEVFTGKTDVQGRLRAKFVKTPGAQGTVVVRAELQGPDGEVRQEASVVLYLSEAPPGLSAYLPMIKG